mmetsp:Transcript_17210/g.37344  ORF Transcript_17210/g.37344 Transcript_17210/m.37344 type:complete len:127 (-) Transcript_17210:793-1173(-)
MHVHQVAMPNVPISSSASQIHPAKTRDHFIVDQVGQMLQRVVSSPAQLDPRLIVLLGIRVSHQRLVKRVILSSVGKLLKMHLHHVLVPAHRVKADNVPMAKVVSPTRFVTKTDRMQFLHHHSTQFL